MSPAVSFAATVIGLPLGMTLLLGWDQPVRRQAIGFGLLAADMTVLWGGINDVFGSGVGAGMRMFFGIY
jgi:hypothetical protein